MRDGRLHPLPSPSIFGIPTTRCWRRGVQPASAEAREHLIAGDGRERRRRRRTDEPDDESVADFYRRHFGPATVSLIAEPLLGGIHAGDVEKLSIATVAPRLVAAAAEGRLFQPPAARPDTGDGLFKALRGGMGELVSAIESRLPAGSVRVRTGAHAVSLAAPEWQVATDGGHARRARGRSWQRRHTRRRACWRGRRAPRGALRRGAVRLDRERGVRVAARERRSSAGRQRLRRRPPAQRAAYQRVHVGVVEVAGPRAAGHGAAARVLSAARPIRAPSTFPMPRSSTSRSETSPQSWASRAPRTSSASSAGRAPAPSTTSAMRLAWRASKSGSHALPGLFVAGSGFHSIGIPDCVADGRAAAARAAGVRCDKIETPEP